MTYLIDTDILIDHLRGNPSAGRFLLDVETGRIRASISVITEYELLSARHISASQLREIRGLLSFMPSLAVTPRVARLAAEIRRRYQTDVVDALIAATAQARHAVLVTRNLRHFRPIKGLRLHTL